MNSKFISCGDSQWDSRSGETVEILHHLTSDRVDPEVGPMFRIRFNDGVETSAFLDELPDLERYRFGEVVFDITTCIRILTGQGAPAENKEYDSRDLYGCIFRWAHEFAERYRDPGDDYLMVVEEFAITKLREYFGLDSVVSEKVIINKHKEGLN